MFDTPVCRTSVQLSDKSHKSHCGSVVGNQANPNSPPRGNKALARAAARVIHLLERKGGGGGGTRSRKWDPVEENFPPPRATQQVREVRGRGKRIVGRRGIFASYFRYLNFCYLVSNVVTNTPRGKGMYGKLYKIATLLTNVL